MTTEARRAIRKHLAHSDQYFENALSTLRLREAGKAGELLWGSLVEAFHALAAARNVRIKTTEN
jgi:hypothetical protein